MEHTPRRAWLTMPFVSSCRPRALLTPSDKPSTFAQLLQSRDVRRRKGSWCGVVSTLWGFRRTSVPHHGRRGREHIQRAPSRHACHAPNNHMTMRECNRAVWCGLAYESGWLWRGQCYDAENNLLVRLCVGHVIISYNPVFPSARTTTLQVNKLKTGHRLTARGCERGGTC